MYGVSKINIETSLMMISVQDVEFKGNSLARYLQIFADNGVVVDMISPVSYTHLDVYKRQFLQNAATQPPQKLPTPTAAAARGSAAVPGHF